MLPCFQYSRLSTDPGSMFIRLVHVEKGGVHDPISCNLRHVDLNTNPVPKFEALSYSWQRDIPDNLWTSTMRGFVGKDPYRGSTETPTRFKDIICNGKRLTIQQNLHDFLLRFRAMHRGLPLWIDAICIDQEESDSRAREEKYHQLQIMGYIYRSAQAVLVWLGESSTLPSSFLDLLSHTAPSVDGYRSFWEEPKEVRLSNDRLLQIYWAGEDSENHSSEELLPRYHMLYHLSALMNRDYFQRSWIIQEIALARKLCFYVGSMEIPTEHLLNGIHLVMDTSKAPNGIAIPIMIQTGAYGFLPILRPQGDPLGYEEFLFLSRDRKSSRREDKVFAFLGLLDESLRQSLTKGVIDRGNIHVDRLYYNCAMALVEKRGWSWVLSLVAARSNAPKRSDRGIQSEESELPSWLPDLNVPLWPKPFWYHGCSHFCASGSSHPNFHLVPVPSDSRFPSILRLSALQVDVIEQVGESWKELDRKLDHINLRLPKLPIGGHFLDLVTRLGSQYLNPAGSDELTLDVLVRTLTADFFKGPPTEAQREQFIRWLTHMHVETKSAGKTSSWLMNKLLPQDAIMNPADTVEINGGVEVSIPKAVDAFLEVHNSPLYPGLAEALRTKANADDILKSLRPDDPPKPDDPETVRKKLDKIFDAFDMAVNKIYRFRRIFRTRNWNLVGIAHPNIRRGDMVCIIAGADTPFILREIDSGYSSKRRRVSLIGSAYVHGIMSGECTFGGNVEFEEMDVI